jgi:two-component system, sensor histidine kinase PdtaS
VHEMLSSENLDDVDLKKLAENILSATARGLLPDARQVVTTVVGESFMLPSSQATYVALILNELIQNAVEHGLKGNIGTELTVYVSQGDDQITLDVVNDGEPLPADFDIRTNRNLGLKIVESLVHDNLMGEFSISSSDGHTRSVVKFPR